MNTLAALLIADSVRTRIEQGDCPTEAQQPRELVEESLCELQRTIAKDLVASEYVTLKRSHDALVAQREADTDRMERATVAIESLNAECNKLSARCDSLVVENAALKRREEGAFNIATDRTEEHIRFQKQRDALVAALESIRCRSSALAKKTSVEIRQELHGIHADAVEAIAAIKTAMRAS